MYIQGMAKTPKRPRDPNQLAKMIVDMSTGADMPAEASLIAEKNAAAVALGRLGGLKGGKARADGMTPEKRREIARKAAVSRWSRG